MMEVAELKGNIELVCSLLDESVSADNNRQHETAETLVFQAYDVMNKTDLFKRDTLFLHGWYQTKPADFTYALHTTIRLMEDQLAFSVPDFEPDEFNNVRDLLSRMKRAMIHGEEGTSPEIPITIIIE